MTEVISEAYGNVLNRIIAEMNRVHEYVHKNFSEVEITTEFNDDSANPLGSQFHIKTRIFTGKGMHKDDQLLKWHKLTLTPTIMADAVLMDKWLKALYPNYTDYIARLVNSWYNKKKEHDDTN